MELKDKIILHCFRKGMLAGFQCRNLIFAICFWLITLNMFLLSNG